MLFSSSGLAACDPAELPQVPHARKISLKKFRGSAIRYRCHRGFKVRERDFFSL